MLLLRPDRSQYHNSNAWVAFIRTSAPTLPGLCFLCQHICNVANLLVPIHCSLMYTPKNEPEIVIDLSQMISYINISRRAMVSSSCHTNVNLLKYFTQIFVFDQESDLQSLFNSMMYVCCWWSCYYSCLGITVKYSGTTDWDHLPTKVWWSQLNCLPSWAHLKKSMRLMFSLIC